MRGPYRYVGPEDIRVAALVGVEGRPIASEVDFAAWIAAQTSADLAEPFTFVVGLDGVLRLAPRRSEHVACAGGDPVLGAGEIGFTWTPAARGVDVRHDHQGGAATQRGDKRGVGKQRRDSLGVGSLGVGSLGVVRLGVVRLGVVRLGVVRLGVDSRGVGGQGAEERGLEERGPGGQWLGSRGKWAVREVTNQSTGYCPDADSWPAVAAAIDRAGLTRPDGFTSVLVYRRCDHCGTLNVIRDADFTCAVCDSGLATRQGAAEPA